MKTVFKYKIEVVDRPTVDMPRNGKILHVGEQGHDNQLFVWALVNTEEPMVTRRFRIFGTGHPVEVDGRGQFIGTVQMKVGLVWHVFEEHPSLVKV